MEEEDGWCSSVALLLALRNMFGLVIRWLYRIEPLAAAWEVEIFWKIFRDEEPKKFFFAANAFLRLIIVFFFSLQTTEQLLWGK